MMANTDSKHTSITGRKKWRSRRHSTITHTLIEGRKKWRPKRHSLNQPRSRESKEERKERRYRRVERRERKRGVDGVVEEDQQGLCNWKHKSDEKGR